MLLANAGITLISKFLADRLPRFAQIHLDAACWLSPWCSLFSPVSSPACFPLCASPNPTSAKLSSKVRVAAASDSGGRRTRSLLVVCEVALSLVLLIGAGLMVRTLWELSGIRPGFDPNNVLTMSLSVPANKFPTPAGQISFFERALQQVRTTPGIESAGVIDDIPMSDSGSHQPVQVEGQPVLPMSDQPEVDVRSVSSRLFQRHAHPASAWPRPRSLPTWLVARPPSSSANPSPTVSGPVRIPSANMSR